MPLEDPNLEGFNVAQELVRLFWNRREKVFQSTNRSTGTSDDEGHYFVWPVSIAIQSLVDAGRVNPHYQDLVEDVVETYGRYYDSKRKAYTATFYFDGNNDIYYDDNAQVASSLITAYEATGQKRFLDLGRDNVSFLMTGAKNKFGGVRWHIEKEGANTCTTAEVGCACLRLARHTQDANEKQNLIKFGDYCHEWLFSKMQDPDDKLMFDGLESDGKVNKGKLTYNQGTPLTLCALLYEATQDEKYYTTARSLAASVSDPNTTMFDRDTPDHKNRYYRDSLKFYQLLVEGYADYLLIFGEKDHELSEKIREVVNRHLFYVYNYLRLANGHAQYNGTMELYRLDKARYDVFKRVTGEDKEYQPDTEEREGGDGKKDMAASLMNMGSAARVFFQSARVLPKVNF